MSMIWVYNDGRIRTYSLTDSNSFDGGASAVGGVRMYFDDKN